MPDERYLKEIASELRLIRKELQRMNMDPLEKLLENNKELINKGITHPQSREVV